MLEKLRKILGISETSGEEVFEEANVSLESARKVQQDIIHSFQGVKEVEGVGISSSIKGYSVKINLSAPLPKEVAENLPKKVDNVPVKTQVTGRVVAF